LRVRNDYSNTAFISSHVCRKPCPFFLQANIFKDEKLLPPPVKRGYNFEMERRIKIRRHGFVGNPFDNNLAKFSHIGPVAADLEFKMHAQLAQIFISGNKGQ